MASPGNQHCANCFGTLFSLSQRSFVGPSFRITRVPGPCTRVVWMIPYSIYPNAYIILMSSHSFKNTAAVNGITTMSVFVCGM